MTTGYAPAIGRIYAAYQAYKKETILWITTICWTLCPHHLPQAAGPSEAFRRRYSHVLVDEAQDTSKLQHAILLQLSAQQGNLFGGDEDQSIYSFRGAYPQALLSSPRSTLELSF